MRDNFPRLRLHLLAALILTIILSACSGEASATLQPPRQTATFAPETAPNQASPTVSPIPSTATPTPTIAAGFPGVQTPPAATEADEATALSLQPSATPPCLDGLTFIEDVTIPDGTVVTAGASLDKRWRVQNSGTCNWDRRYRISLISGPDLGLPEPQALFPARSGYEALVRMLLTAPSDPGTYRSAWQAVDPAGAPFGDPIYIEITVGS